MSEVALVMPLILTAMKTRLSLPEHGVPVFYFAVWLHQPQLGPLMYPRRHHR